MSSENPRSRLTTLVLEARTSSALLLTENLYGRIEFGFAADRLGLGNLPGEIQTATGVNIGLSDVFLYNFNLRGLLVKENADDNEWIPAVTFGVTSNTNDGICSINRGLNGASNTIGYARKTARISPSRLRRRPTAFFGKPLIATAGLARAGRRPGVPRVCRCVPHQL